MMLMRLIDWNDLDSRMKNEYVRNVYLNLTKKKTTLFIKRLLDICFSLLLLILLLPLIIIIGIIIKIDSKGPIIFKQTRVTQFYKEFTIYKFRTMIDSRKLDGKLITVKDDDRITRVGKVLRKIRFDEFPQLINILKGEMTFVGARPEVMDIVVQYSNQMFSTLLLPAGLTSRASIMFKNENDMLMDNDENYYINVLLEEKMKHNIEYMQKVSIFEDINILIMTFVKIFLRA